MLSTRVIHRSMRRATSSLPIPMAIFKSTSEAATMTRRYDSSIAKPANNAKAQHLSQREGMRVLEDQRLQRPISPHLSIYKATVTMYGSGLNRITGSLLSGALYIFGATYAVAPLLGWQITAASMVAAFAKWPFALQVAAKTLAVFPFTYHAFCGGLHLIWDTATGIAKSKVAKSMWVVVALSVASGLGLVMFV